MDAVDFVEQSDFEAVQSDEGLNSWRVRRKSDQHVLPGTFPTALAARTEIAKVFIPTYQGRGWARAS